MKATTQHSLFNSNHDGILTHDGWVKVAKSKITGKITNIQGNTIRVKSYHVKKGRMIQVNCLLHKRLLPDKRYLSINDTVSIKRNCSQYYIVGYRKADADNIVENTTLDDFATSENTHWIYQQGGEQV